MASICSGSLGNITTSYWKYSVICLYYRLHQLNVVAYWDKPHENNGFIANHSCVKPVGLIWYFGIGNVVISSTFGGLWRHHLMIKYTIFYPPPPPLQYKTMCTYGLGYLWIDALSYNRTFCIRVIRCTIQPCIGGDPCQEWKYFPDRSLPNCRFSSQFNNDFNKIWPFFHRVTSSVLQYVWAFICNCRDFVKQHTCFVVAIELVLIWCLCLRHDTGDKPGLLLSANPCHRWMIGNTKAVLPRQYISSSNQFNR